MTIDEFLKDVAPKMCKGYIAMSPHGWWDWYSHKPHKEESEGWEIVKGMWAPLICFDIDPVDDWKESLREIKHG